MSATNVSHDTPAETAHGAHGEHEHGEHHPTEKQYVVVALILAVLTGIEAFTYFKSVLDWGRVLMPALLVMMGVKFYLIAAYFMHLRYDQKILRRVFLTGIVLAVAVYVIALTAFKLFASGVPH